MSENLVQKVIAGDVVEVYDALDALLATVEKHAPRHASRIEQARDLVFQVRVELESGDE